MGGIGGVEAGERDGGLFTNGCCSSVVLCLGDITTV